MCFDGAVKVAQYHDYTIAHKGIEHFLTDKNISLKTIKSWMWRFVSTHFNTFVLLV